MLEYLDFSLRLSADRQVRNDNQLLCFRRGLVGGFAANQTPPTLRLNKSLFILTKPLKKGA
jgi:hypothetical protein